MFLASQCFILFVWCDRLRYLCFSCGIVEWKKTPDNLRVKRNGTPQLTGKIILPKVTLDDDIARVATRCECGENRCERQIPFVQRQANGLRARAWRRPAAATHIETGYGGGVIHELRGDLRRFMNGENMVSREKIGKPRMPDLLHESRGLGGSLQWIKRMGVKRHINAPPFRNIEQRFQACEDRRPNLRRQVDGIGTFETQFDAWRALGLPE